MPAFHFRRPFHSQQHFWTFFSYCFPHTFSFSDPFHFISSMASMANVAVMIYGDIKKALNATGGVEMKLSLSSLQTALSGFQGVQILTVQCQVSDSDPHATARTDMWSFLIVVSGSTHAFLDLEAMFRFSRRPDGQGPFFPAVADMLPGITTQQTAWFLVPHPRSGVQYQPTARPLHIHCTRIVGLATIHVQYSLSSYPVKLKRRVRQEVFCLPYPCPAPPVAFPPSLFASSFLLNID